MKIQVTYDAQKKRLVFDCPFMLSDVIREFPSRRFDPKSKKWHSPLVKANVTHLLEVWDRYPFVMDQMAVDAVNNFQALSEAPKRVPFPVHVYDFTRSASGFTPMNHQSLMLDMAWNLPAAAWFAKMGTGKTFAAIHLACARFEAGLIDRVVILCPSTLRFTWKKEFAKYATIPYDYRIHDTKASWLKEFYGTKTAPGEPMQVLAVSVEGLGVSEALYDSACGAYVNSRVFTICDESSRIKSPTAKRTERAIQLGMASAYKIILNGTPIALGIQDLYSQYEFLDPNIIGAGDYYAFRTRYMVMGGFENKKIVGYQHIDELMKAIIPYTMEVGKEVLNLPPKIPKQFDCQATVEQKGLFRLIIKGKGKSGLAVEPDIKVDNSLERTLRLQQVIGGWLPRAVRTRKEIDGVECEVVDTVLEPLKENPKMDLLMTIIEGHYEGSKFIIWTTFKHEIEAIAGLLRQKYGDKAVTCYYGEIKQEERSIIEDRYCNDPDMRFFIGNPAAAGLGLTLISGMDDKMFYYAGTNAYIYRAQSEDRSHRKGQERSVVVGDLVMERTYDVIIQESIKQKMDVEEYLMTKIAAGINPFDEMMG
jgi:SNF2 family DNA or RNA helicase